MKKTVSLLFACIFIACALCACGGKTADLNAVLKEINTKYPSQTAMKELTDVSELKKYYSIDEADVNQFAAEITSDSSAAPVEIVLVEAKDTAAADKVKTQLDRRFDTIYSQYASYSADQLAVIEVCKVEKQGSYVTMVVSENYSGIMEIVNAAIK